MIINSDNNNNNNSISSKNNILYYLRVPQSQKSWNLILTKKKETGTKKSATYMLGSPQVVVPHPPGVFDLEPEIVVPANGVDQLLMKAMLLGMKDGKDGTQLRCNVVNDANFQNLFSNFWNEKWRFGWDDFPFSIGGYWVISGFRGSSRSFLGV